MSEHEPTGDPEHIAYGKDYYWRCSCGASAPFITTKDKAKGRGKSHEENCPDNGTVEVQIV